MRGRTALRALLPFALHALARAVDAALGTLLRTTLDLPGFVGTALGLVDPARTALSAAEWTAAGAAIWVLLGLERARREDRSIGDALTAEAGTFWPLLIRPAVTVLALVALAIRPTFPYGATLPVALTQDWGLVQDAACLAALVAVRLPPVRLPVPGIPSVVLMAFLGYGLLTPGWARHWEGHPGNEPKTLRMAVALGHGLSLDAESVTGPMEELPTRSLAEAAGGALSRLGRESRLMLAGLLAGPRAVGAAAIRATRIARQTVRGKDGGIYYVLPPGPSLLLAPALRLDRALNRRFDTPGRLGVTLLLWNALAAALVGAIVLLLRDVTDRPGLATLLGGGFALAPPFLFYFYQFYPEPLGALVLALAFHLLLFAPDRGVSSWLPLGLLLATLPWLHQKFLPVWAVLVALGVVVAVERLCRLRALLALLLPQAASLYLFALYNFAITGSVRPDALYLAWGPAGVSSARIGEGAFGLLLDARYGLLPYAPIYILAAGGLLVRGGRAARLRLLLLPGLAYYLTVAAADNWSGAVCALGRYVLPVAPLLAAACGVALAASAGRRAVAALALLLASWTGLAAVALFRDPNAANDCSRLLDRSVFVDGHVYLPDLFFRSARYGAPGQDVRVLLWIVLAALAGLWLAGVARGRGGRSLPRMLAGLGGLVLAASLILEHWPSDYRLPRFHDGVEARPGATVFFVGGARLESGVAVSRGGALQLLVRSATPLAALRLQAAGTGVLRIPERPSVLLPPRTAPVLEVPLPPGLRLVGKRGVREDLYRVKIEVETPGAVRFRVSGVR